MLPSSTHAQGSSLTVPMSAKFGALMSSQIGGLSLFVAIAILLQVSSIGCPIKFITGMSCPGCGLTRAWESVLFLNIGDAVRFHPFFWVVPLVFLAFAVSKNKNKINTGRSIAFGMIAFCFIALWALRLGYDGDFSMILPVASGDYPADIVSWQVPRWWEFATRLFES